MVEGSYWMFDDSLYDRLSEDQKFMVLDTLASLSALSNKRLFWLMAKTNREKAVLEQLKTIGMHSGEKRVGMGEFRLPSSFMALLQYEFMLGFLKDSDLDSSFMMPVDFGLRVVKRFRDYFNIPSFVREDDVLVVEVFSRDGDEGYVEDFKKVDEIDNNKYYVSRCMPSKPQSIGMRITKGLGFVNTVGDVSGSSERIREIFGIPKVQEVE